MKISIIVPIYNSEKYLHQCVDSILNQTYSDFELLLINDGSRDKSGEICDEYAVIEKRVKVLHKENGGVSTARNLGIENAIGEYITFIDSDDWVDKTYLEAFFKLNKNPKRALVQQGTVREHSNGEKVKFLLPNKVFLTTEYASLFYSTKFIRKWPFLHSKLFHTKIIKRNLIKFDEDVTYGEDLLFILDYILFTKEVILINEANYYYTYQEDSLSRFYYPYESENKRLESIIEKLQKIDDKFKFDDKTNKLHKHFFSLYLFRIIRSLYLSSEKKERSERVELLKKRNTIETRSWFKNWHPINSRNEKIVRYLFLNQFTNMLDFYSVIYMKLNRMLR